MTFQEAIVGWAVAHPAFPENVVNASYAGIKRHDGWSSDSGTFWDSETIVSIRVYKVNRLGKRYSRVIELYAPSDLEEFLEELFDPSKAGTHFL